MNLPGVTVSILSPFSCLRYLSGQGCRLLYSLPLAEITCIHYMLPNPLIPRSRKPIAFLSPLCPYYHLSLTQSVPATFSQGPLSPCPSDCFPPWGHRKSLISLSRQLKTTSGRLGAERLWFYCRGLHKFLLLSLPILTPASETGRADIISAYILEIRNWGLRDRVLGCDCTVEIQVRLLSRCLLVPPAMHHFCFDPSGPSNTGPPSRAFRHLPRWISL